MTAAPPPLPQPPVAVAAVAEPPRKRRSCCCLGCLIMLGVLLAGALGILGYGWYRGRPQPSPVDQEYREVPEYFPPASSGEWR